MQSWLAAAEQAVKTAYKAVMKPKEGTILTVARGCAEAAVRLGRGNRRNRGVPEGHYGGWTQGSGCRHPKCSLCLKQAGVVDAGGRGLLIYSGGRTQAAER